MGILRFQIADLSLQIACGGNVSICNLNLTHGVLLLTRTSRPGEPSARAFFLFFSKLQIARANRKRSNVKNLQSAI